MKIETLELAVIITKGFCAFAGPAFLAYNASVGQWANTGDSPSALEWSMILSATGGAGVLGFGAFLSSAFGKWMRARADIDITNGKDLSK